MKFEVYRDSLLIIFQVKGEWKTKDEKLKPYQNYLLRLANEFEEIKFNLMSRDKNEFVDALVTLDLMTQIVIRGKIQPINIEVRNLQAYYCTIEESLDGNHSTVISRDLSSTGNTLRAYKTDEKTLRRIAINFHLDGKILYKRSFNGTLLRCLNEKKVEHALKEIYEGICATHTNKHTMARQMQRYRYFWLTIERDYVDYVRKCHKFQIYGDKINTLLAPIFNITSPWFFYVGVG
jgi:hypothetical protein